jgi:LysM repeat protein
MKLKNQWIQPRKWLYRVVLILVILSMMGAVFPQPAQAAACAYKHKVAAGDTLAYLGFIYQIDWFKIADANKLTPPYVIQIGQVLCIPTGAKSPSISGTSDTGTTKGPVIAAQFGYGSIVVAVEKFPGQKNYFINAMVNIPMSHYRLGRMKTNKNGAATESYKLPGFLMDKPELIICAKDVMTDATLCTRLENPYYLAYHYYFRCTKNGR